MLAELRWFVFRTLQHHLSQPSDRRRYANRMSILFPLASHPDSEEYQVDQTIVWIIIPNNGSRSHWVTEGRAMFHAVWRDANDAILMAQMQSRIEHPEFWDQPWLRLMADSILAVRGIWIFPVDGTALYEVYDASGGYIPSGLSGQVLPDEYVVDVTRGRDGKLAIKSLHTEPGSPQL